ncbi:hypothetical protein V6N13_007906 [Hibiscus sabdariffa]
MLAYDALPEFRPSCREAKPSLLVRHHPVRHQHFYSSSVHVDLPKQQENSAALGQSATLPEPPDLVVSRKGKFGGQ